MKYVVAVNGIANVFREGSQYANIVSAFCANNVIYLFLLEKKKTEDEDKYNQIHTTT